MKNYDKDKDIKKAAMKQLRAQRKDFITAASSKMKIQKKDMNAIKKILKDQPSSIPYIAKNIDMPTEKTLWYMATMKKYGQIVETGKEGAFFIYSLNEPEKNPKTEV